MKTKHILFLVGGSALLMYLIRQRGLPAYTAPNTALLPSPSSAGSGVMPDITVNNKPVQSKG